MTKISGIVLAAAFVLYGACAQAEDVKTDAKSLCDLVAQKKTISLKYAEDPADAPARVVQVYGVGSTSKHNTLLFGKQVSGHSKSTKTDSPLPGWRNFTLTKIKSATSAGETFTAETPPADSHKYITAFTCKNDAMK
jgi:hypothetical protein